VNVGTVGIAAWVAYIAFAVLVLYGLVSGGLGLRGLAVALGTCLLARGILAYVPNSEAMFSSVVALVDIGLVLVVCKGDVGSDSSGLALIGLAIEVPLTAVPS
jgi:hypothetical protein